MYKFKSIVTIIIDIIYCFEHVSALTMNCIIAHFTCSSPMLCIYLFIITNVSQTKGHIFVLAYEWSVREFCSLHISLTSYLLKNIHGTLYAYMHSS